MLEENEKFEYKFESFTFFLVEDEANKLGEKGWEAVGLYDSTSEVKILFKRRITLPT